MYPSPLAKPTADITDLWAESGYQRISANAIDRDNPVRRFHDHYCALPGWPVPNWQTFDICAVPPDVVPHVALGEPVYASDWCCRPKHFVYTLEGNGIRSFIGRSMIGLKIGHVMLRSDRNSLRDEIEYVVDGGQPVMSQSDLDIPGPSPSRFTRGVFLFRSDAGRIERLLLVLCETPALSEAPQRKPVLSLVRHGGHLR